MPQARGMAIPTAMSPIQAKQAAGSIDQATAPATAAPGAARQARTAIAATRRPQRPLPAAGLTMASQGSSRSSSRAMVSLRRRVTSLPDTAPSGARPPGAR